MPPAAAILAEIHAFARQRALSETEVNVAEANVWLDRALESINEGNATEALRCVELADELGATVRDLEHIRAIALCSLNRLDEAMKAAYDELLDFPDNKPVVELLEQITQELSAASEAPLLAQVWKSMPAVPVHTQSKKIRVGMVTTWQVRCGIGLYARDLLVNSRDSQLEYIVFARQDAQLLVPDTELVHRCWRDRLQGEDDLEQLYEAILAERIDLVNIQFNYSFFGIPTLGKLMEKLHAAGIRVLLTFHSTAPGEIFGAAISVEQLGAFAASVDKVLCYKKADTERLQAIFGTEKVIQSNLPIKRYPRTPARIVSEQRKKLGLADSFVIATHGFALPNKGLEIILEAIGLLKARGITNVKFLSVTSRYVRPEPSDETLARCAAIAQAFGIQEQFILVDHYLEQQDIHQLLQLSDLIAFCYSYTEETASAAVRQCIQTRVPLITSPLAIFGDIAPFSRQLATISPQALADEIVQFMITPTRDLALLGARALYLNNTSTDILVHELEKEIKALLPHKTKPEKKLPKISVVSPSFNCAKYLRRCIEGVLAQNYPNFEHIIVDGASTDETVAILKEYPHLKWVSEPDEGEAEALNKALKMASGEIINWLNVDDVYFDNEVLHTVAEEWEKNPDAGVIYGKGLVVNEEGEVVMYRSPLIPVTLSALMRWHTNLNLTQPAMFYTAALVKDVGFFREDLFFSIDYEYWMRISAKGYRYHFVDRVFANATLVRDGAKSGNSVEDQHTNWQLIAASFQDYLSRPERINFWRDFYLYRIRNPLGYGAQISFPEREEALLGMTLALLEMNDVHNAAASLNQLTGRFPPSPDVYWIIAEVQHRVGQGGDSCRSAEMGKAAQTQASPANGRT